MFWRLAGLKKQEKINSQEKIVLSSEVAGYKLEFKDEAKLKELLAKIGFWDKDKVSFVIKPDRFIQPQGLEIVLVSSLNKYYWRQLTENDSTVASINVEKADNDLVQIKIYFDEQELKDNLVRPTRLDQMVLFGLYGLSPQIREKAPYNKGTGDIFQMLKNDFGDYRGLIKLATN